MADIPYIDPRVQHIGVSRLRQLNADYLRMLDHLLVVRDNENPLVVILPYEQFMGMQSLIVAMNREGK